MANPLQKAARLVSLGRASVPLSYVRLGLEIAEERGFDRVALLRGAGLDPAVLDKPEGRLGLAACVRLVSTVWGRLGDPSLGYEFGLRSNLTAHGNLGFGLMSHATVGEALAFGLKYGRLRNPLLRLSLRTEGDRAVIEAREALPLGRMRQIVLDAVLVSIARIGRQLSGAFRPELELWFDGPAPAHFERYRSRLPPVVFNAGANQFRFPAEYLARPLHTRDPGTARQMAEQCERELALIGDEASMLERVRAVLADGQAGYPDLEQAAQRLHVSGRTLKRHLQAQGASFQALLDEARERDSLRLLADPALAVAEVAQRLGYSDPASFTRAFRKWTGTTPSAWRSRLG